MEHNSTGNGALDSWEKTSLWKSICNSAGACAGFKNHIEKVCLILGKVEKILVSGGTSPQDFTLHDAGHAYRVAELMNKLIPDDVKGALSCYELTMLLLSAYCHDIGMVPNVSKERQIYSILSGTPPQQEGKAGGSDGEIDDASQREFEDWYAGIYTEMELSASPGTCEEPEYVAQLYIRYRHNDWSEEWMRENLSRQDLELYPEWLSDLISLCKSHHEGYEQLRADDFDPILRGGQVLNRRYLACLLRLADVLEIDPERTPAIIYRHRQIDVRSKIYWAKGQGVSCSITSKNITIHATPRRAEIHQAINQTIKEIDKELDLCCRLNELGALKGEIGGNELVHHLDVPQKVRAAIVPLKGAYEFIDGSFRPNAPKLVQILGGHQLYGNDKLAAVRELVSNAIDGVKEAIALQRLELGDPSNPKWEKSFGETHSIKIKLESREENGESRYWLICTDTGVGMTKDIIENKLLVPGEPTRAKTLSLEARCRKAGFHVGRTGQFGIGVLSYFMIADRVIFETKRSQLCGDEDDSGWCFETEGVGTFGELRRSRSAVVGTTVSLRLKPGIGLQCESKMAGGDEGSAPEHTSQELPSLTSYLQNILVRVPCPVSVCDISGAQYEIEFGWVRNAASLRRLMSSSDDMKGAEIQMFDSIEGSVMEGKALFRATPFMYRWRKDSGFLFVGPIGVNWIESAETFLLESWHGMKVSPIYYFQGMKSCVPCVVEFDWVGSDNSLLVASRDRLIESVPEKVMQEVGERISADLKDFRIRREPGSTFQEVSLWEMFRYPFLDWPSEASWPMPDWRFGRLSGWVASIPSGLRVDRGIRAAGGDVTLSPKFDNRFLNSNFEKRLVFPNRKDGLRWPFVIISIDAYKGKPEFAGLVAAAFPPSWSSVCGATITSRSLTFVFNNGSELYKMLDGAGREDKIRGLKEIQRLFHSQGPQHSALLQENHELAKAVSEIVWFSKRKFLKLLPSSDLDSWTAVYCSATEVQSYALERIDPGWLATEGTPETFAAKKFLDDLF